MKWISLIVFLPFVLVSGRLTGASADLGGTRLASAATVHTWHKAAVASDDNGAHANAEFRTTGRSYGSRLRIRATSRARVRGAVDCTRGLDNESRTFSFHIRDGHRRIPTPLLGGQCNYSVSAELPRGGKVEIGLYVLR